MKRIWITGAEGHVGSALIDILQDGPSGVEDYIIPTDRKEVDVTNLEEVMNFVRLNRPDVIINCASLTDVATCEANQDEAFRVNAIGVKNIAAVAEEVHAKVIHISTDDVFSKDANRPYNEFDDVHPQNAYGRSKAAGEKMLAQHHNRFVIIRSSWVYGTGADFVSDILCRAEGQGSIAVPDNQIASPTSARELAKYVYYFIEHDDCGLYHVVSKGSCSRYEYAKTILEYTGLLDRVELVPIGEAQGVPSTYSELDTMMLRLSGIEEPKEWKQALKEYIQETGGRE